MTTDGEHARFDAVYAEHRDDVWRYLRRRASSEPEDLTTEVFLVAWRRRDDLPDEPLPWLYGVARNVLANHRRGGVRSRGTSGTAVKTRFTASATGFGLRS